MRGKQWGEYLRAAQIVRGATSTMQAPTATLAEEPVPMVDVAPAYEPSLNENDAEVRIHDLSKYLLDKRYFRRGQGFVDESKAVAQKLVEEGRSRAEFEAVPPTDIETLLRCFSIGSRVRARRVLQHGAEHADEEEICGE
jgi:hypothetical protein